MKRACQSVSIKRLEWHVHGSDRGRRARVGRKSREGGGSARLLNVGVRETSRERRGLGERLRDGDDIRAVDHRARVLTEHSKLGHCGGERARHVLLRVDVGLPEARRAFIARKFRVRLETDLAVQGRLDFTLVARSSTRSSATSFHEPCKSQTHPGNNVPLSCVSTKNCESNTSGVESNGVPGIVGSTLSAAAIV